MQMLLSLHAPYNIAPSLDLLRCQLSQRLRGSHHSMYVPSSLHTSQTGARSLDISFDLSTRIMPTEFAVLHDVANSHGQCVHVVFRVVY